MTKKILFIMVIILTVTSFSIFLRLNDEINYKDVDSYMQSVVNKYNIPGLSVVVVRNGDIELLKSYGEAKKGEEMQPNTPMYIGSLSKSFTALAVLRMVDKGLIDLDKPVAEYIPWFKTKDENNTDLITVRHLLNHTSGLIEKNDSKGGIYEKTLEEQVARIKEMKLDNLPGEKYNYYNVNYGILGLILEKVTGKSFDICMKDNVFEPLGLHNTYANPLEVFNLARGYSSYFGFSFPSKQKYYLPALPSGYIISCAEDFGKYIIQLMDKDRLSNSGFLKSESINELFTPPKDIQSSYAMGWMVGETEQHGKFYLHGGTVENFHTKIIMLPESNVGVGILVNRSGLIPLMAEYSNDLSVLSLMDIIIGKKPEIKDTFLFYLIPLLITMGLFSLCLYRFSKIRKWISKLAGKSKVRVYVGILFEFIIPIFIFSFITCLPAVTLSKNGGWMKLYELIPDVAVVMLIVLIINILIPVIKLFYFYKGKNNIENYL